MPLVTVACVWVKANVPYPVVYVERLRAMVGRYLDRSCRFVCVTDRPERVPPGVEPIAIPPMPPGMSGWWAKVELFRPQLFSGRVLYLDLDVLVRSSLAPIVEYPSQFALVPDAGTFQGRNGLKVVKRFNSSVMVWDAGCNTSLYETFSRDVTRRLHGDQDWIGEQMPHADTMPLAWFPRFSELHGVPPTDPAKVVLVKKPKNEQAAAAYSWFRDAWV